MSRKRIVTAAKIIYIVALVVSIMLPCKTSGWMNVLEKWYLTMPMLLSCAVLIWDLFSEKGKKDGDNEFI